MATNLDIDQKLLAEALRIGKFPTKKATVNAALKEFVDRHKREDLIALFGTIDFDPAYDYKKLRGKRR